MIRSPGPGKLWSHVLGIAPGKCSVFLCHSMLLSASLWFSTPLCLGDSLSVDAADNFDLGQVYNDQRQVHD